MILDKLIRLGQRFINFRTMWEFVFKEVISELGWGYLGVCCVACVPYREKVAGDANASMIDGAYPVLLTRH